MCIVLTLSVKENSHVIPGCLVREMLIIGTIMCLSVIPLIILSLLYILIFDKFNALFFVVLS